MLWWKRKSDKDSSEKERRHEDLGQIAIKLLEQNSFEEKAIHWLKNDWPAIRFQPVL
jgi:hypothetical protein